MRRSAYGRSGARALSAPKYHNDRHEARQDLRDAAQHRDCVRPLAGRLERHEYLRARSWRRLARDEKPFAARARVAVGIAYADPAAVSVRRQPACGADVVVEVGTAPPQQT